MWNSWSTVAEASQAEKGFRASRTTLCPTASPVQALLQPLPWIRQRAGLWGVNEAGMRFLYPSLMESRQKGSALGFSPCFAYAYLCDTGIVELSVPYYV